MRECELTLQVVRLDAYLRLPYQYTEAATGLVNLDARWYNPHTQRFVQPDLWNFRNTGLPQEIQQELMRFTGLDTAQLLRVPSQQMAYGYVSGNPLSWTDWLGLCYPESHGITPITTVAGVETYQKRDGSYYMVMNNQTINYHDFIDVEDHLIRDANQTESWQTVEELPKKWFENWGETGTHNIGTSGNEDWRGTKPDLCLDSRCREKEENPYRGYQVIFDDGGSLVTDPVNRGSYDYEEPGTIDHVIRDVDPWVEFGNGPDDSSSREERIEALPPAIRWRYE